MDSVLNCNLKKPDEVIMKLPDNIATHRKNRNVCIDKEIHKVIKHLWNNGIDTLNCCCGHKMMKPSVIINSENSNIKKTKKIIAEIDNRDWEIKKHKS